MPSCSTTASCSPSGAKLFAAGELPQKQLCWLKSCSHSAAQDLQHACRLIITFDSHHALLGSCGCPGLVTRLACALHNSVVPCCCIQGRDVATCSLLVHAQLISTAAPYGAARGAHLITHESDLQVPSTFGTWLALEQLSCSSTC